MLKGALIVAFCALLFSAAPASADVLSCGANLALFFSPVACNGAVGPAVTVDTPATQAPGVAFNISGHYYNSSAPTGLTFCTDTSTGCNAAAGAALSSPTIGSGAWTSTAADVTIVAAGTYYVCVAEVPSTTVKGCSASFVVVAPAETIAATNPGTLTASASYTQAGTYTNGPPAAIDWSYDGVGCANVAGSPTIAGGNISFTNTAPSGLGSHTITLCDHASHSIFGTSTSFTVNAGGCSNSLDLSDGCNSQYIAVVL